MNCVKRMQYFKRSGFSINGKFLNVWRSSNKGFEHTSDVGFNGCSSLTTERSLTSDFSKRVARQVGGGGGNSSIIRDQWTMRQALNYHSPFQMTTGGKHDLNGRSFARYFASKTTDPNKKSETRKEVSTIEDPFDAPTYNIPEKPVTFTEGASYSLIILAGLGVAAAAAYGVFKELIFQPKEYKIFNKALERIQNDSQVRVRIGSPITGYGSESRNRAARQRVPHKVWTDEDGVEHIVVNFHIRGPHGAGKVYSEMFNDKEDRQWKFMYLIVEVTSPSPAQLMLESYVPA